jgi:hypothetical protein
VYRPAATDDEQRLLLDTMAADLVALHRHQPDVARVSAPPTW